MEYYELADYLLKLIYKERLDNLFTKEDISYIESIDKDELAILTLYLLKFCQSQIKENYFKEKTSHESL